MAIDFNEFAGQNQDDDETIVNPNLADAPIVNPNLQPGSEKQVIDASFFNDDSPQIPEDAPGDQQQYIMDQYGDSMLQRRAEKVERLRDAIEQSDGELTQEAIIAAEGFDPINAMKNVKKINTTEAEWKLTHGIKEPPEEEPQVQAPVQQRPVEEEDDGIPFDEPAAEAPAEEMSEEEREIEAALEAESEGDYEEETSTMSEKVENVKTETETVAAQPVSAAELKEQPPKSKVVDITEALEKRDENTMDDLDKELEELEKELEESQEEADQKEREERIKYLKEDMHKKMRPVNQAYDLSSFTVTNKPVTVNNTVRKAEAQTTRKGDWALWCSRQHITMERFYGEDLDTILSANNSRNTTNAINDQLKMLHSHIVSEHKPEYDTWTKVTSYLDLDHLYAAAYIATFADMNFVPYDCDNEKCKNSFITDSLPFTDLVKFKDKEMKKEFMKLVEAEDSPAADLYVSELIQISDTYAITLREPSIFDAIIKPSYIDADFRAKHRNAFALSMYIDQMFEIDAANRRLNPINIIKYTSNVAKTEKAKIIVIEKITRTLTSDQFNMMAQYISQITKRGDGITYIIPEVTCPKCGTKIESQDTTAEGLLFLRHRLANLVAE